MGDISAINLIDTTRAITRLPRFLRSKFFRDFKDAKLKNQSLSLTTFEIWLGNKVAELFNPRSAIIDHQEKQKRDFHKDSHRLERDNRNPYRMFLALAEGMPNYQSNILRCWLCSKDHKIAECNELVALSVNKRLRLVKVNKLCFNCLSNSHMINNCKSKVSCRVDNFKKRHHTLLHPVNEGNDSNSPSNDTTQNYQTNQHTIIGLNLQTSKSHQQSEAAVNTKLGAKHTFLQLIPVKLSNGHIFMESNALLEFGSDTTLLRKDIAESLNLKRKQERLSVTSALSRSHNIDSATVSFDISSTSVSGSTQISVWVVHNLKISFNRYDVSEIKKNTPSPKGH